MKLWIISVSLVIGLAACANGENTKAPAATSTSFPNLTTSTLVPPHGKRSDERTLTLVDTIANDNLQPKSIVHSGTGLFFAQNMMYRHNISVFDRQSNLVATIDDKVDLKDFGVEVTDKSSVVRGSPVEAAFSSDAKYAYVSNYAMYGNGWDPSAVDTCQGKDRDPSFVYRVNTSTFAIDQLILVGAVPKYLAVSPDNKYVVVSNFCSLDVSIIDVSTGKEKQRIDVGLHPRGIAITNDSSTAYVTVMGGGIIIAINLRDFTSRTITSAGYTPRHLVLSPDNSVLYITNNKSGQIRAINPKTDTLIKSVTTGVEPRSMAISDDGLSLYVVNYQSDTMVKVRTSDMQVIQTLKTGHHPVGITYDAQMRRVWVANYTGSLWVFEDK
ncbi:MAG: YncE family protein [Actinobacteria bacterium]|nr:YncE family protein [Actinomycetota bacterium]